MRVAGRFTASLLFVALAIPSASTQQPSPASADTPLAFEVATVKQIDQHEITGIDLSVYPGGRLVIHAHRLAMLIAEAFNIPEWEIVGGDQPIVQAWYDVEGKPPEGLRNAMPGSEHAEWGSIQDVRVRSMLQSLLVERFHLKFHFESQPGTVYELKRSDGLLRLKPAELNSDISSESLKVSQYAPDMTGLMILNATRPVEIRQASMLQLAHELANIQRAPVSDQTGLSGFYNFKSHVVVTNEDLQGDGANHLIVDTVPEMGLKLVKTHGQVERFVIDSVEWPDAN